MPGVLLPTYHNGRMIWMDSDVQHIIDKLHYGDPTAGWEGDERLALYRVETSPDSGYWELWRLEESGNMSRVAMSKPGASLDGLIPALVRQDMRRARNAFDPVALVDSMPDIIPDRDLEEKAAEMLERTYFEVAKEVGHHY